MAAPDGRAGRSSAATYETLIGLLAVTGMRVGEAIRLDRADLLLDDASSASGAEVRPVADGSRSTRARSGCCATTWSGGGCSRHSRASRALFVHPAGNGGQIRECAGDLFRALARRAASRRARIACRPTGPRLRHTFAVNTLVSWYREGADVQARLPQLSTFLGHADVTWTYGTVGLQSCSLAADRLEAATGAGDEARSPRPCRRFFTERLIGQRQPPEHRYRGLIGSSAAARHLTWRNRTGQVPRPRSTSQTSAQMIGDFLVHLRGGSWRERPRTPQAGSTAGRSLFASRRSASPSTPSLSARVLSIQAKTRHPKAARQRSSPARDRALRRTGSSRRRDGGTTVLSRSDLQSGLRVFRSSPACGAKDINARPRAARARRGKG